MRILMLAQSYAPVVGGEEWIVEDLSAQLARCGHEVAVATLRQPLGVPPVSEDGVVVHLLEGSTQRVPGVAVDPERQYAPPAPDPLAVRGLRRVLRKTRPDIVHAHNWLASSYLPLDRRGGPAFVLSLHDYSLVCATKRFFYRGAVCDGPAAGKCLAHSIGHYGAAKGVMISAGMRLSQPWLRRRVDMFLPVSEAVRELSGLGPDDPHRVIPNFVGALPPALRPDDPRLAGLPAEPYVFYFGDVTEDKGVGVLIEAWRSLERRPPLVLAGRSLIPDMPEIPGLVQLGRLPRAVAIEALRRSLFSVAPSLLPESFGIVALEAAAAGKPAVVADSGGLADVVVDGQTGLLVAPGDVTGLRAALARLAGDPALRERMGEAASSRAREFGPERIVPQFEAAYEVAVASRLKLNGHSRR